ncbi:T-cell receptor alpha chain V region 2B4 [Sciurus carolinensis]|nr:T-cell receptor alpha chain V region 2B4 [Sciurus carolinensis]
MKRLLGAVLGLLCTQLCCVRGMQVEQSPPALILQEGASSTLLCKFSTSVNNVQWFRQNSGGRLISLFYIPSGTKQNGRLTSTTVSKERRSSLNISSSQTTDSAVYFCAVDARCFSGTCSCCTNPQGARPLPQSQAPQEAPRQRLHLSEFLTYIGRVLPADILGCISLGIWLKPHSFSF